MAGFLFVHIVRRTIDLHRRSGFEGDQVIATLDSASRVGMRAEDDGKRIVAGCAGWK